MPTYKIVKCLKCSHLKCICSCILIVNNVRVHLCVRKKEALAKGAGLLPHHHRDPSLGNPACSRRHPTYSFQQPSHSSRGTSPFLSEKTK